MNYFPFHVGDYVASTAHLSWDEDMAYTRLIRVYYQTEKPIPKDKAYRLARATTSAQKVAVDSVLEEFFVFDAGAYRQARCEEEISKFCDKQSKAKRSADARWKHPQSQCESDASAMRTHSDGIANHKPLTINQEPNSVTDVTAIDDGKTPEELTKAELWAAGKSILSEQGMAKAQCGSFVGKLVKDYGDMIVIDAVRAAVVQRPADAAQYLVATCQTAIGQRKPANKQEALEARNRAVADAWANEQEAAIESV